MNSFVDECLDTAVNSNVSSSSSQELIHLKIERLSDDSGNVSNAESEQKLKLMQMVEQNFHSGNVSLAELSTFRSVMQRIIGVDQSSVSGSSSNGAFQMADSSKSPTAIDLLSSGSSPTAMMSLDSDSPSVAWTSTFPNNQTDSLWYTSAKHFENLDLPDDLLSDYSEKSAASKQSGNHSSDNQSEQVAKILPSQQIESENASKPATSTESTSSNTAPNTKPSTLANGRPIELAKAPRLRKSARTTKTPKAAQPTKSKKSIKRLKMADPPQVETQQLAECETEPTLSQCPTVSQTLAKSPPNKIQNLPETSNSKKAASTRQSSMYSYLNKASLSDKYDQSRRCIQSIQEQQTARTLNRSTVDKRKATSPLGNQRKLKKPKHILKNINPSMYVNSPHYNYECVLCGTVAKNAQHYVKQHKESEVFISRLSPETIQSMTMPPQNGVRKVRDNVCPFCDKYYRYTSNAWLVHFAAHIGTYLFKCNTCGIQLFVQKNHLKTCENADMQQICFPKVVGKSVCAYACKLCNYVQFFKESIDRHLRNEHELINDLLIDGNIRMIWLLPNDNRTVTCDAAILHSESNASGAEIGEHSTTSTSVEHTSTTMTDESNDYSGSMPDMPNIGSEEPPKNVRKCFQYANETYQVNCIVCQTKTDNMLDHHRRCHPNSEYYISRISDAMLILCNCEHHRSISLPNGAHKALCVFCAKDMSLYKLSWMEHFAQHTAEYLYACTSCNLQFATYKELFMHTKCNSSHWKQLIREQLEETGVRAFCCILCNFIQFSSQRIEMHLKEQHDKNENDVDFHLLYAKIMLSDLDLRNVGLTNINGHNNDTNAKATEAIVGQTNLPLGDKSVQKSVKSSGYSFINVSVADESVVLTDFNITLGNSSIEQDEEMEVDRSDKNIDADGQMAAKSDEEIDMQTDVPSDAEAGVEINVHADQEATITEPQLAIEKCVSPEVYIEADTPEEMVVLDETPRNNCTTICYSNPVYRTNCVLCHFGTNRMGFHFNKMHPDLEYYISRISVQMIDRLRANGLPAARKNNKKDWAGFCAFCETYVKGQISTWLIHLAMHTNEPIYECRNCSATFLRKSPHSANGKCAPEDVHQILQPNIADQFMHAHICKLCNFVQFSKQRMLTHIFCQHDIIDQMEINEICMPTKIFNMNETRMGRNETVAKLWKKIKNKNNQMYPTNIAYQSNCVLCDEQLTQNYAKHYVQKHETENYMSRLSAPKMVLAMSQTPKSIRIGDNYAATCLFCEEVQINSKESWVIHMMEHTGEFMYKCQSCHTPETFQSTDCCATSNMIKIYDFQLTCNYRLYGYGCKLCNYVQLSKENVLYHLQEHHTTKRRHDRKHYSRIMLLDLNEDNVDGCAENEQTEEADGASKWLKIFKEFDIKDCHVIVDRYVPPIAVENVVIEHTEAMVVNTENCPSDEQPAEILNSAVTSTEESNSNDEPDNGDKNILNDSSLNIINQATEIIEILDDSAGDSIYEQNVHATLKIAIRAEPVDAIDNAHKLLKFGATNNEPLFNHAADKTNGCHKINNATTQEPEIIEILDDSLDENDFAQNEHANHQIKIKSEPNNDFSFNRYTFKQVPIKSEPQHQTAVAASINVVKPWTNTMSKKSERVANCMLTDVSLFALFKCMGHTCSFSTQSCGQMGEHLNYHAKFSSDVDTLTAIVKKEFDGRIIDYLECPYCPSYLATSTQLIAHVIEEHSTSVFQCSWCFYRSIDAYSVILHTNKYHRDKEAVVLMCKGFTESTLQNELLQLLDMQLETVAPIVCKEHNREFYVTDHFISHLQIAHSAMDFTCHFCAHQLTVQQTKTHFNCHNIGDFQCLYCRFSGNLLDKISMHMADKHPNKLMIVIVRNYRTDYTPSEIRYSGRDALILLNAADDIDADAVRFRELELNEARLDSSDPKIIAQMDTGANMGERTLDTRQPPSPMLQDILENYTLRFSDCQIMTLKDFKRDVANVQRDYTLLEQLE